MGVAGGNTREVGPPLVRYLLQEEANALQLYVRGVEELQPFDTHDLGERGRPRLTSD